MPEDSQAAFFFVENQPTDYDPVLHRPTPYTRQDPQPFPSTIPLVTRFPFPFLTSPSCTALEDLGRWPHFDSRNASQGESFLTKPTAFDENAINEEFQEDFRLLEDEATRLDLDFQDLVKDLKLWIAASVSPVTEEAKLKYVSDTFPQTRALQLFLSSVSSSHLPHRRGYELDFILD